jgi:Domain of unknown function (DUF4920)
MLMLAVAAAAVQAGPGETFGKGVALREATPVQLIYDRPADFIGKTIRIDGVVSEVCEDMGCWMALADIVDHEMVVRLKVDDGAGIVFPISARGKAASAEGVFEKMAAGDAEAQEAAAEQGARAPGKSVEFGKTYQIKATGAIVR